METFVGIPIYATHHVERGSVVVGMDLGRRDGRSLFEGVGLGRGIAYVNITEGVERGYLVRNMGMTADLLDAVNGRVVTVHADNCVEVEERYRCSRLATVFRDPSLVEEG